MINILHHTVTEINGIRLFDKFLWSNVTVLNWIIRYRFATLQQLNRSTKLFKGIELCIAVEDKAPETKPKYGIALFG